MTDSSMPVSPELVDHGSAMWPPSPPPCSPPPTPSLPGTNPDLSQNQNQTQKTKKSRTWYHTEYSVPVEQFRELPFTGEEEEEEEPAETQDPPSSDPTAPLIRRRGAWVDYRDVILAHQAHKLHNTPKARRKQWE